jgi:hypothetical protein
MPVPAVLLIICFLALMGFGAFVVFIAVKHPPKGGRAVFSILKSKFELRGPAWLVMLFLGILMLASPVIVAAMQKMSQTPFRLPASATAVLSVPEPNYQSFRFIKDLSQLDLRSTTEQPWFTRLPGWSALAGKHTRIRPATLLNYMVIKKVAAADSIHIKYGTSGTLDLRCLTHAYRVNTATEDEGFVAEVVADVAAVPVGGTFNLIIEATYWNAFSGAEGDDYTTYGHSQAEQEEIATLILFPDSRPYSRVELLEKAPRASDMRPITLAHQDMRGPNNHTYYWSSEISGPWYITTKWQW